MFYVSFKFYLSVVLHSIQGQMLESFFLPSFGNTFDLIFLKLANNVCLDDISIKSDHLWGLLKRYPISIG